MRDGVLTVEMTLGDGSTVNLASRMYADSNTLYRGHLEGFSQTRKMSDALAGRTSMSIANLIVHNEHEEYDSTLFSGSADIRIGADTDPIASMDAIMLDASIELVSRTDNKISIAVLDGQNRGNTKQQRIFDTSGDGFGVLLPELWGKAIRAPLVALDGDTGLVFGCVGPMVSIGSVYVGDTKQSTGRTIDVTGNTATVTFTVAPEGSVFVDATGLGSKLPGTMLEELLTRVSLVCQGWVMGESGNDLTLDERVDDATETLVGKVLSLQRASGGAAADRTITAFDSATRIITYDGSALSPSPITDDIYSIEVDTAAGGFTSAQVDSTGFDTLDTDYPYQFGLIATNGINAISMQDQLLSPLLCHMGPRRDGIVQLKQLEPATGTADLDITRIVGEIQRRPMPVYWRVDVRYRIDNTGGHWRSVSAFDATIKATYPEAKAITIEAPIQDRAGADLIAEKWLTCFGSPTELATMTVDHDLSVLDLGDVVNVVDDRYQFVDGKLAVVAGMTDVFDGHDQLIVWVESQ